MKHKLSLFGCPFCGKIPTLDFIDGEEDTAAYTISCANKNCGPAPGSIERSISTAVELWNQRHETKLIDVELDDHI